MLALAGETALKDVYGYFDKNETELMKDLTSYVVDNSIIDSDNKDYIKTTGNKVLDSYRGKKNQKRKSKIDTKKDTK